VQVHLQLQQEGQDGQVGYPKLQLRGRVQQFPKPQLSLQKYDLGQEQQQLHFGKEQHLMDGRQLQLQLHGLQSPQQRGNFSGKDNPSQQQQQQQIQERLKQGMPLHIKRLLVLFRNHDSYQIRLTMKGCAASINEI